MVVQHGGKNEATHHTAEDRERYEVYVRQYTAAIAQAQAQAQATAKKEEPVAVKPEEATEPVGADEHKPPSAAPDATKAESGTKRVCVPVTALSVHVAYVTVLSGACERCSRGLFHWSAVRAFQL